MAKKLLNFPFKVHDKGHECYKSCFCSATPIDHTQVCHMLLQLRMLELIIGKGHQVIKVQAICRGGLHVKCKCMEHRMALNLVHYNDNSRAVCAWGTEL